MRGCFENILGMAGCGQWTIFHQRITEESGSPCPLPRTQKKRPSMRFTGRTNAKKNAAPCESQNTAEARTRYHAREKMPQPTNHRAHTRKKRRPMRITAHSGIPYPLPLTRKNAPADKPQGTRTRQKAPPCKLPRTPHTSEISKMTLKSEINFLNRCV